MTQKKQKVALVTGASRGIGKGIAVKLAEKGYITVINYNSSKSNAQEVADIITKNGGRAELIQCDVANSDQVREMFSEIKTMFGPVDVLINNAGITKDMALFRMKLSDWHDVLNTNLNGTFFCIKQAALDMMKQKSGRIINISSLSSYFGAPGQTNYASSKAGMIGMTRCLAAELGPMNITVNSVIPGLVPTDMTDKMPAEKFEALSAGIPLKRFGSEEDIAEMVEFLASEKASYITGQIITVDGGLSCNLAA